MYFVHVGIYMMYGGNNQMYYEIEWVLRIHSQISADLTLGLRKRDGLYFTVYKDPILFFLNSPEGDFYKSTNSKTSKKTVFALYITFCGSIVFELLSLCNLYGTPTSCQFP